MNTVPARCGTRLPEFAWGPSGRRSGSDRRSRPLRSFKQQRQGGLGQTRSTWPDFHTRPGYWSVWSHEFRFWSST